MLHLLCRSSFNILRTILTTIHNLYLPTCIVMTAQLYGLILNIIIQVVSTIKRYCELAKFKY